MSGLIAAGNPRSRPLVTGGRVLTLADCLEIWLAAGCTCGTSDLLNGQMYSAADQVPVVNSMVSAGVD